MKTPWNFARVLPLAGRLISRGRLPTLIFAVARKGASQGFRLGMLKDDWACCRRCAWLTGVASTVPSASRHWYRWWPAFCTFQPLGCGP